MFRKHQIYWNPILETLPEEKLRELQLRKFRKILEWTYHNSPFYRWLYQEAGLEPGDIKSFEDIRKVPKVDKVMRREAQQKEPFPYGDMLAVPPEQVTIFKQTSGTTGVSIYQADTWRDWEWWAESWCYILYAQGYRATDRVFIPFGYSTFVAFWAGHYGAEKLGCEVIPGGALSTEARILKMQELRATAFMATPTYVLTMADVATRKLGINPSKDLQIKRITVAGEPGGSIPATKKRMEEAWGAKVYDHVGATEIGAWSYECTYQCGLHVNEALFLVEIEDVDTGEIITTSGRKGKVVITALDRMAQPCIRFDSKDITEWSLDECECGRTFRLIKGGVVGRTDDIIKVKGVLLAPASIEEVVRAIPELSNEYEVLVTKKGDMDDITLKVELVSKQKSNNIDEIKARLVNQLKIKTNLRYNVEFHDYGTLPRHNAKARRFKDLRHKE
jgi:phenylacetate-CoA ligase